MLAASFRSDDFLLEIYCSSGLEVLRDLLTCVPRKFQEESKKINSLFVPASNPAGSVVSAS